MEYNKICGKDSIRYAGTERICSRLGDQTFSLSGNVAFSPQTQQRLGTRIMQVDQDFRAELLELVEAGDVPVEFPNVLNLVTLLPAGSNSNSNPHSNANTSNDIFYYHTNHLGSTAFVTDNNATVTQGFLYAPFGEITTEYAPMWQNGLIPNYTFNAKELDEETGMYYYEARYMAPPTFISRDPLLEKYFWMSPYAYCANNPLKYVDPDGEEVAPIYDHDGNFLGTDNQGLQGEAIIMNKSDFKQNMSHNEALAKENNTFNSLDAYKKYYSHFLSLSSRPDYDGIVTREEGIAWAKEHPGALHHPTPDNTLYIDASKLDFGNITTSDFENGIGKDSRIQTLNAGNFVRGLKKGRLQNTVYAIGRVDLILLNESGDVKVVNNKATDYDWNTGGGLIRNALIMGERRMNGISDNHGFKTYYYGTGKVKK